MNALAKPLAGIRVIELARILFRARRWELPESYRVPLAETPVPAEARRDP